MARADVLLHPVRLRIVQAFLGDRALTTAELAAELDDLPASSLYRHLALLTRAGVVQVVAERRVRAVVERTYMLRAHAAQIQPDEIAAMTVEQHRAAFLAYVAGMIEDVERYLEADGVDPLRDGFGYRVGALWLTDAELSDLVRDLALVLQPRLANAPAKGRRRRIVYSVFAPAPEGDRGRRRKRGKQTTAKSPASSTPAAGAVPRRRAGA